MKNAIAGMFLPKIERGPDGRPVVKESTLVNTIEMDRAIKEVLKNNRYKEELRQTVVSMGYLVEAINICRNHPDGIDIAVTVKRQPASLETERKKPVTRGGRQITKPVKGKTMAAKRRAMKR